MTLISWLRSLDQDLPLWRKHWRPLKKSEELELQASKLEEKATSLWAKAGEFQGKAIQLLQGLTAATEPKAAAEPSPTAATSTASIPAPVIKVKLVKQCDMQEPATKNVFSTCSTCSSII